MFRSIQKQKLKMNFEKLAGEFSKDSECSRIGKFWKEFLNVSERFSSEKFEI